MPNKGMEFDDHEKMLILCKIKKNQMQQNFNINFSTESFKNQPDRCGWRR